MNPDYNGYTLIKSYRGQPILRPLTDIFFLDNNGSWRGAEVTIDTGADISLFPSDVVKGLEKHPPFSIEQVEMADGTKAIGEGASYAVLIAGKEVELPVISSVAVPRPLLGRLGFLDNFAVAFDKEGFTIEPLQSPVIYQRSM